MPTKNNDQDYDKPAWRDRNIAYVRDAFRKQGFSFERYPFRWVEAFGRSGPSALDAVVGSGLIPSEDYFVGIDNDPEIVWEYYHGSQEGPISKEESARRLSSKRLVIGDIHSEVVPLSQEEIPLGVYNLDLLGLVGHERHWGLKTSALTTAIRNSLAKLPLCILILNHAAAQPRDMSARTIGKNARNQFQQIRKMLQNMGPAIECRAFTDSDKHNPYPEKWWPASSFPLQPGASLQRGPWDFYRSENKTIPMVTTRITIYRKERHD